MSVYMNVLYLLYVHIFERCRAEEEHFDAVWDRGSLHVFKPPDDQRYRISL